MTGQSSDSHLKDDNVKDSYVREEINLTFQACDTIIKDDISQRNTNYTNSVRDEIFMQLQTELFDILLEIYNVVPSWGSFKENFYFHWKRIIGACNFRDLHAYRLIFRCLGNLRPSSIPVFILKPVIRQLDEYRKISEPEYLPSNFELNSNIRRNIIACSNTPLILFQNSQVLNTPSLPVEDKKQELLKNKTKEDSSPDKCNSISYNGNINKNTKTSTTVAAFNETNGTSISLFDNDIISSVHSQNNYGILSDNIHNPANFFFSAARQDGVSIDHDRSSECAKLKNWLFNKDFTFSDESSTNETISNSFIASKYCNSNSTVSSPYGSTCTISSLSPSECNISGPMMAAFQYIQATASNAKNKLDSVIHSSNEQSTIQPKKRPRKNGEIQGVYFDKIRKLWRANWKENGRVKTKGFSVFQFGEEGARQKAIEYRKKMEKEFYILPHSKVSRNSSNEETVYISPEVLRSVASPIKKDNEQCSDSNSLSSNSGLSFENTVKFSENSNSNSNN